jgi:putative PIN family toxin of toxin-antitoxin system
VLRVVLDTNVLVAGLRSRTGASFAVLDHVANGRLVPVLNLPLAAEYAEVLSRPVHRAAHHLGEADVDALVHGFLDAGHLVATRLEARVALRRDPSDGVVVEAALDGGAEHLVTHNLRHFEEVADRISVVTPAQLLRIMAQ